MMRAEAARGLRSLEEINAGGRGFPLNRDYLYGGYFFAFLQERYGEKAIAAFIESYSDNIIPFRVHSNPVAATGQKHGRAMGGVSRLADARASSAKVRLGQARRGPRPGLVASRSPALAPDGTRWYIRGRRLHAAAARAPGARRRAAGAARAWSRTRACRPPRAAALLLAQPEICGNYNYYYDLNRVASRRQPEAPHRMRPLPLRRAARRRARRGGAHGERAGAGRRRSKAKFSTAPPPGESITGVAASGASVVVTSLRDGTLVIDPHLRAEHAKSCFRISAIKHSPRFGAAGRGVLHRRLRQRVQRLVAARRPARALDRGGARRARDQRAARRRAAADDDRSRWRRASLVPPAGHALWKRGRPWRRRSRPRRPAMPSTDAPERAYAPWRSLLPRSWLPLIEVADGAVKLGVVTFGQDALGLHQYTRGAGNRVDPAGTARRRDLRVRQPPPAARRAAA